MSLKQFVLKIGQEKCTKLTLVSIARGSCSCCEFSSPNDESCDVDAVFSSSKAVKKYTFKYVYMTYRIE